MNGNNIVAGYLMKQAGFGKVMVHGARRLYNNLRSGLTEAPKTNIPRPGYTPGNGVPVEKISEGLYGGPKVPMPAPKYAGPNQPRPGFVPGRGPKVGGGFQYPSGSYPKPSNIPYTPGKPVSVDDIRSILYPIM